jgi:hypothetical protein
MGQRIDFQSKLETVLGSNHVYYQPPETIKMIYPCIVYERNTGDTIFADNSPYRFTIQYKVTYIDKNPDNDVITELAKFPMCRYDRHYTADNLNHDVFEIYY